MVKIYNNVRGKRGALLGTGDTLQAAIMDALNNGLEFCDELGDYNLEKLEDYILGAKNDYMIEYIK